MLIIYFDFQYAVHNVVNFLEIRNFRPTRALFIKIKYSYQSNISVIYFLIIILK